MDPVPEAEQEPDLISTAEAMSKLRPVLKTLAHEYSKGPVRNLQCPFHIEGITKLESRMGKEYRAVACTLGWPQFPSDQTKVMHGKSSCHGKSSRCAHWGALQQHADKLGVVRNTGPRSPVYDDDEGDEDEDEAAQHSQKLHHLLAEVLRGVKAAPVQTFGGKVDAQEFNVTIPWPPLLFLEDLRKDDAGNEASSGNLLVQRFKVQGAVAGFPVFRFDGFQGAAVLQFKNDPEGLARAKAFLENSRAERERCVPQAFQSRWATESDWVGRRYSNFAYQA